MNDQDFQYYILARGQQLFREMPWRADTQPYYVLVSELMLQQTQVERVIPKFGAFVAKFPTIESLSQASLGDVVRLWSGLGYNRRAKYLHEAAKKIAHEYDGNFPGSAAELLQLPGVGKNTAGAILVYAFNTPALYVETNIRTVYFHHFFEQENVVSDADVLVKLKATIETTNPRLFYWSLMDYGAYLKQQNKGAITKSKHYKKQTPLKGSVREVRGLIITLLSKRDFTNDELRRQLPDDERFAYAIVGLVSDGLIATHQNIWHLTK